MYHRAEFGAHRIHDDGSWNSEFKDHLERHGIKPILARVKHPQTNGKARKVFWGNIKGIDMLFLHSTNL
jgi:putative transposase